MAEYLPNPNLDGNGITLKALLENPNLLLPPPPRATSITVDGEKGDKDDFFYNSDAVDMAAAFLGPTLWDKTLPSDADLKLEYMDIDEFLAENGIYSDGLAPKGDDKAATDHSSITPPAAPARGPPPLMEPPPANQGSDYMMQDDQTTENIDPSNPPSSPREAATEEPDDPRPSTPASPTNPGSPVEVDVPFALSSTDVALATAPGQEEFDPREKSFTDDDLKPQPMVKKSKKQYVPPELKDDKYWERRRKNNLAAKRSRDARRVKENQIVIRTSFLEKENDALREQVSELKKENGSYKKLLESYKKKLEALNAL